MYNPKKQAHGNNRQLSNPPAIREKVPFDKEVLKFLLTNQDQITNDTVRNFVNRYVAWLYECTGRKSEIKAAGIETLCYVELDKAYYGFHPSDISYYLRKLNQIFFTAMGRSYIRARHQIAEEELPPFDQYLVMELLSGLSTPLGFYVLARYFQTDAHSQDKAWIERACDLFGEFRDLETWRPNQETIESSGYIRMLIGAPVSSDEPFYYTLSARSQGSHAPYPNTYKAPGVPGQYSGNHYQSNAYLAGDLHGYYRAVREISPNFNGIGTIIEAERRRLVNFLKSLRQSLDILNEDPLMITGEWQEMPVEPVPPQPATGNDNNTTSNEEAMKKLLERTKEVFQ